jgi:hypothetical protein
MTTDLANTIFTRIKDRRSVGIDNGILVFGRDGSGGAWYSTGSRPQLGADEIAITFDHRTTLESVRADLADRQ